MYVSMRAKRPVRHRKKDVEQNNKRRRRRTKDVETNHENEWGQLTKT